jgi:hypothetical protein
MSAATIVTIVYALLLAGVCAFCRAASSGDDEAHAKLDEREAARKLYPTTGRSITVHGADPRVVALMRQGKTADVAVREVFVDGAGQ